MCVYDNPETMCRELWRDARVVAHISMALMYTRGFDGFPTLPCVLNVGRTFIPGRVYFGDPPPKPGGGA